MKRDDIDKTLKAQTTKESLSRQIQERQRLIEQYETRFTRVSRELAKNNEQLDSIGKENQEVKLEAKEERIRFTQEMKDANEEIFTLGSKVMSLEEQLVYEKGDAAVILRKVRAEIQQQAKETEVREEKAELEAAKLELQLKETNKKLKKETVAAE